MLFVVKKCFILDCWFVVGDSWSGRSVAVGHSRLLDHVVDVGVLQSKVAVVTKVVNVSSVANVLE